MKSEGAIGSGREAGVRVSMGTKQGNDSAYCSEKFPEAPPPPKSVVLFDHHEDSQGAMVNSNLRKKGNFRFIIEYQFI